VGEFGCRKLLPGFWNQFYTRAPVGVHPGAANGFGEGGASDALRPQGAAKGFQVRDLTLPGGVNAERWAKRNGIELEAVPRILGWGHRSAAILFKDKIADSKSKLYVFPHVRGSIEDAFNRASISDAFELDAIETHDCFAFTEYMAIDHFGITAPGKAWKAVEDNTIALGGKLPVNPSGGLIGLGHPVGATGVRMVLDAQKQVTGGAGDYQVEGASKVATLNIGGTATTTCCFVIGN
jgi:acetyl-CoA C-acetyltransferase